MGLAARVTGLPTRAARQRVCVLVLKGAGRLCAPDMPLLGDPRVRRTRQQWRRACLAPGALSNSMRDRDLAVLTGSFLLIREGRLKTRLSAFRISLLN